MTTTTIRVSSELHNTLKDLSRAAGVSMQEILERAIEAYRRQQILEATNAAYGALRADTKAWQALEAEWSEWDATLADGLEEV